MPTKVITHAIRMAPAPAPSAMICGRLKMPLPTMPPTTSAVSGNSPSLLLAWSVMMHSPL